MLLFFADDNLMTTPELQNDVLLNKLLSLGSNKKALSIHSRLLWIMPPLIFSKILGHKADLPALFRGADFEYTLAVVQLDGELKYIPLVLAREDISPPFVIALEFTGSLEAAGQRLLLSEEEVWLVPGKPRWTRNIDKYRSHVASLLDMSDSDDPDA
ncbi:hypothetical protein BJ508DRAFT_306516 [Ascobolus immersus RN42]|uniref:Uncharacterized protein n=1 Tax=Ascobolus immersus RN42 TaxID=1160509 RepID=A0A3N4IBG3_ASCIM|nr:hypothetical protein BJ508DRAFT_306516 [Ascobolus immersus RN42]